MATFAGWEAAVLRQVKAPVTKANVAWLDAWQQSEGGGAAYNPLNTTEAANGASDYNSVGVKNYPSASSGAEATGATLLGWYPAIVAALRSGNPQRYAAAGHGTDVVSQLNTWGSHGFAATVQTGNPATSSSASSSSSKPAPAGGSSGGGGGGIFAGIQSWLLDRGKLIGAYLLLAGVAGGLFLTGLNDLGLKPPAVIR